MSHPDKPSPSAPQGLWRQTTLLRHTHGQEEAISVGPDGVVWSFQADGAAGPRLQSLGLPADFVAVGRTAGGRWVVVAAKGLQLQYRSETAPAMPPGDAAATLRWAAAQHLALPDIAGAVGVRKLYTHADARGLRIFLIVNTWTPQAGAGYVMASCPWTEQGPGPFVLQAPSLKREVPLSTMRSVPSTTHQAPGRPSRHTAF